MKTKLVLILLCALATGPLLAESRDNWTRHCAKCHGPDGQGDTRAGRKLSVENLADPRKQAKLSDADIFKIITEGAKDDAGDERMPAFGAKLSEEQRNRLVAHVRALRKEVGTAPTASK